MSVFRLSKVSIYDYQPPQSVAWAEPMAVVAGDLSTVVAGFAYRELMGVRASSASYWLMSSNYIMSLPCAIGSRSSLTAVGVAINDAQHLSLAISTHKLVLTEA